MSLRWVDNFWSNVVKQFSKPKAALHLYFDMDLNLLLYQMATRLNRVMIVIALKQYLAHTLLLLDRVAPISHQVFSLLWAESWLKLVYSWKLWFHFALLAMMATHSVAVSLAIDLAWASSRTNSSSIRSQWINYLLSYRIWDICHLCEYTTKSHLESSEPVRPYQRLRQMAKCELLFTITNNIHVQLERHTSERVICSFARSTSAHRTPSTQQWDITNSIVHRRGSSD